MVNVIAYLEQELVTTHGNRAPTSMDPASALGLVFTAISLTRSCLQVCRIGPSKHSQDYLQSISKQLWDFNGSLKNLETHYEIYEDSQARSTVLASIKAPLLNCKTALDSIREHLESESFLKKFVTGARFDTALDKHLSCLKRSRMLFHEVIQADQTVLLYALEKYAHISAEDIRDLQNTVNGIDERNRKDFEQVHESLGSIQNGQKDILRSHEDSSNRLESQVQVDQDRRIMNWLSPLRFEAKQIDVLSRRSDSTGTWILETEEFRDWAIGSGKTLWCTGIPGAGKTVVASIAVDHLRGKLKGQKVAISCVYCSYKDQAIQTPTSLIASILYQILTINMSISDYLRALHERHELKKTTPTLEELFAELQASVHNLEKFFVIIDALDECSDVTREEFLIHMRKLQPAANLMFTTRPANHVASGFPEAACVEIRAKDTDVRSYCESKIRSDYRLRFMREDVDLKNDVISKLVENAQEMFLLAVLHIESLASQLSPADVRNALNKLPQGLDDTYHEALQRIAHQGPPCLEMANNVLSWISHAYRPLTIEELQCALAVRPGLPTFDEDAKTPMDTLISICAGLVTTDPQGGIVRLVHYTTQEFLEKIRDSRFLTAQADITRTCLTYLSFDHPRSYDRYGAILHNVESRPFLSYAAQHWRDHMRASPEPNPNEIILQILGQPVKVQCIFQAMNDRFIDHLYLDKELSMPPLYAAAILGLDSIVLLLLERGADLTEPLPSNGITALNIAIYFAQQEVIRVLIDHGASVNGYDRNRCPPLLATITAAGRINEERAVAVARLLLERGADVDAKGDSRTKKNISTLMLAAYCGRVQLVELLLKYGADANQLSKNGSPVLFKATIRKPRIYQLLREHGADLNARNHHNETILLSICCLSSLEKYIESAIRMLLSLGTNIHADDGYGESVLLRVAVHGNCGLIKVLVQHGADIHSRNELGRSVLFLAIEGRKKTQLDKVVLLLLELGADVNLQDSAGDTALTIATAKGKLDIVKLLLSYKANPNTKNEAGDTALTLAAAAEATLKDWLCFDKAGSRIDDATQLAAFAEGNLITLELLLRHGASVDVKNKAGDSALTLVAAKGKPDAVKLLLNDGADPHTKTEAGDTALTLAVAAQPTLVRSPWRKGWIDDATQLAAFAEKNLKTLELLLNYKASVDVKNKAGDTALILAAANGKLDAVKLLLGYRANPYMKNEAGDTALSLSVESGHSEVHQVLLDHLSEANHAPESTEEE